MAKSSRAQAFPGPVVHHSRERRGRSSLAPTRSLSPPDGATRRITPESSRRAIEKERVVHDEPMDERPRRRPVLLAMLVAAALLLAIAGTGAFAGNGPSRSS